MGGGVPLGYEAVDRKLVIIPKEAKTVREIMERYLDAESIKTLVQELERDGVVSKRRVSKKGNVVGGVPFKRGALKWLLSNPIYVGEVRHKDKVYPGQHDGLVDRKLFDAVQTKLADRTSQGSAGGPQRRIALLAGMIRDDRGRPMSPTHTKNHGRRYTYYASSMNDDAGAPALRLPAGEIEQAVRKAVARWFRMQANVQELAASKSANQKQHIFIRAAQLANEVEQLPITDTRNSLSSMGLSVSVSEHGIKGAFEPQRALGFVDGDNGPTREATFKVALHRHSHGHESRLRLQPFEPDLVVRNDRLVELLGRAFQARAELMQMGEDEVKSIKMTRLRHLQRLAKLSYLDPTIIQSILAGTQPKSLGSRNLWRLADLPIRYADQRTALGFQNS